MPNQPLQAIGAHGNERDSLAYHKAEYRPAPHRPYCERHRTYFCPCVHPGLYRKPGELEAAMKAWDDGS